MNPARLKELRELIAKATGGPWKRNDGCICKECFPAMAEALDEVERLRELVKVAYEIIYGPGFDASRNVEWIDRAKKALGDE